MYFAFLYYFYLISKTPIIKVAKTVDRKVSVSKKFGVYLSILQSLFLGQPNISYLAVISCLK